MQVREALIVDDKGLPRLFVASAVKTYWDAFANFTEIAKTTCDPKSNGSLST